MANGGYLLYGANFGERREEVEMVTYLGRELLAHFSGLLIAWCLSLLSSVGMKSERWCWLILLFADVVRMNGR